MRGHVHQYRSTPSVVGLPYQSVRWALVLPFILSPLNRRTQTICRFMSSTGEATSSTSNIRLIIDAALVDYSKTTGIDLSKHPFTDTLEQSNSPEAILYLLQEREKTFEEYRDGNQRLISCLSPAVRVLQAFSGILGEAVSLVSVRCRRAGFLIRPC
jgi:hypothetical protein